MPGVIPVGLKCLCLVSPSWHRAREAPTNIEIVPFFEAQYDKSPPSSKGQRGF